MYFYTWHFLFGCIKGQAKRNTPSIHLLYSFIIALSFLSSSFKRNKKANEEKLKIEIQRNGEKRTSDEFVFLRTLRLFVCLLLLLAEQRAIIHLVANKQQCSACSLGTWSVGQSSGTLCRETHTDVKSDAGSNNNKPENLRNFRTLKSTTNNRSVFSVETN